METSSALDVNLVSPLTMLLTITSPQGDGNLAESDLIASPITSVTYHHFPARGWKHNTFTVFHNRHIVSYLPSLPRKGMETPLLQHLPRLRGN